MEKEKKWEEAIEKYDEASLAYFATKEIIKVKLCNSKILDGLSYVPLQKYLNFCKKKLAFCNQHFGEDGSQSGLWKLQLGKILYAKRQVEEAISYTEKSIDIFKERKNREGVIDARILIEAIYIHKIQYLQAEKSINATLELIENSIDSNLISSQMAAIQKAESLLNLANLMILIRDDEKIIEYCNQAIIIGKEERNWEILRKANLKIARAYSLLNDFKQAEEYILNAIEYTDLHYGKNNFKQIIIYNRLGSVKTQMRQYGEALQLLNKGLEANKLHLEKENYNYYLNWVNLGTTNIYMGNFQKADSMLNNAIKVASKINIEETPGILVVYLRKCQLWSFQKTNFDSSIILLKKMIRINKTYYGENHPEISQYYRHIGYTYSLLGDYENALLQQQKALIANSYQFSDLDFSKNPELDDFIIEFEGLFVLKNKIKLLFDLWIADSKNTQLLEPIISCTNLMYELLTKKAKYLGEGLSENAELLNRLNWFVFENIAIYYELHKKTNETIFVDNYYQWLEKLKEQILLLVAQKSAVQKYGTIPIELLERERQHTFRVDSIDNLLQKALKRKDKSLVSKIQNNWLFEAKRKRKQFIVELEKSFPNYYQLKYDFKTIEPNDFQKLLNNKTLFVELSINYQESPRALYHLKHY